MKIKAQRVFNLLIKTFGLFLAGLLVFLLIYFVSSRLILDKKAKYTIDEGKYILNRMAEEYEKFLKEKEKTLTIEKEKLIIMQVQAKTLEERRQIEERLRQIALERNNLSYQYTKNERERKEMEANLISMKENLSLSTEEISRLNKKYNELSVEKNNIEQYWNNYINELKRVFKEKYKFDLVKLQEIEKSFNNNNGKNFIINEFGELYRVATQKDNRVELITREKDTLIREKQTQINSLVDELDKKNLENEKLKKMLKSGQVDKDFYLKFHNDYSEIIDNFNKLKTLFANAEKLYNDKNYKRASDEYIKVLNVFNEINQSYKKVRELTDSENESKANELYKKAMDYKNKGDNESAYNALFELVKNYPGNKYFDDSVNQLLKISDSFSDKDKISVANKSALDLYDKAVVSLKNNKTEDAEELLYKIITDYPVSDYTKKALEKIKEINKVYLAKSKEYYDKELSAKFKTDYDKFKRYYSKNNLEKARFYYFSALKTAFDIYSYNSIDEFKKFEDQYIEMLVKAFEDNFKLKYKIKDDE
jgi:hypothetical protein